MTYRCGAYSAELAAKEGRQKKVLTYYYNKKLNSFLAAHVAEWFAGQKLSVFCLSCHCFWAPYYS